MWGLFCCSLFGQVLRSWASTCQSLIGHHGIRVVLLKANQGSTCVKGNQKNHFGCYLVDGGQLQELSFLAVGRYFWARKKSLGCKRGRGSFFFGRGPFGRVIRERRDSCSEGAFDFAGRRVFLLGCGKIFWGKEIPLPKKEVFLLGLWGFLVNRKRSI